VSASPGIAINGVTLTTPSGAFIGEAEDWTVLANILSDGPGNGPRAVDWLAGVDGARTALPAMAAELTDRSHLIPPWWPSRVDWRLSARRRCDAPGRAQVALVRPYMSEMPS